MATQDTKKRKRRKVTKKKVTKKKVTKRAVKKATKKVTKKRGSKKPVTSKKRGKKKPSVTKKVTSKSTKKAPKKVSPKKKQLTTSKIVCSCCKTEKKTSKPQIERLVAVFGSLDLVHEKYHCIECRRKYNVRKDGRLKPEVRKRKKKKKYNGNLLRRGRTGVTIWARPEGVSTSKWNKTIKETITWGKKEGLLVTDEPRKK